LWEMAAEEVLESDWEEVNEVLGCNTILHACG